MCGIVGYIGIKEATPVLVNALRKLEYRGYDSAGIAVLNGENIFVRKVKGALNELEKCLAKDVVRGTLGIGHTRWATHGEPNDINAHPHINESGTIAVVHNGIIENYVQLKAWLQAKGVVFRSETDSEVVAHLINYYYEETKDLVKAVLVTLNRLEGSYALGVVCKDYPDRLIAARKESPLIVGLGKGENFIASDVPAVLEHTREVIFLDQKQIAVLYSDHVDLLDENGNRVTKEPYHVEWDMSSAEKGGYEHFMLKEIFEQPKALTDTLRPRLVFDGNSPKDIKFDEIEFNDAWLNAKRIVITACGTAYHAGVVAKYAFEQIARVPVVVDVASEFRYRNPIFEKDDIFIVISQSGETADTLAALRIAKQKNATTLSIVNAVGSTIARESDINIYTYAGPEIAVATTKGYTSQVAILSLLCINAMKQKNILDSSLFSKVCNEFSNISNLITEVINLNDKYKEIAKCLYKRNDIFFIGRGIDYSLCMEGSLKLKEISYIHSEAYGAGELKHGTISLIEDGTPVIAIATNDTLYEKTVSNIKETKARGSFSIFITTSNECSKDFADITLKLPKLSEFVEPLLIVTALQLIAYETAKLKDCDIDKPKNLAKSVTVE